MTKKDYQKFAIIAIILAFIAGCASTKQYSKFSQAGAAYAEAVDRLLVVSASTKVDATSVRLLQDDKLQNQTEENYKKLSEIDEQRLEIIARLRAHTRLLALYFEVLRELAESDAPKRAQQAAEGVVKGLNDLGKELRGSELLKEKDKSVFTSFTKVLVGAKIRSMLKKELEKRKDTIQMELKTQEELIKVLSDSILHDLNIIREDQEQRLVIAPLVASEPIANPQEWIAKRCMILTSSMQLEEIEMAKNAAQELRECFEDLITGKVEIGRLNILLINLESIIGRIETINR